MFADTELYWDRFQKQQLVYKDTVAVQGESALAVEDEQIRRVYEDSGEIIYWYQPNRSSQPIPLIDQHVTLDDWIHDKQAEEAHPQTRFEMLYGDSQAAVFVASPKQFNPPLKQLHPLPHTVTLSRIHRYLLGVNLEPARISRVCKKAFKSIESDYLHSLQGFATAVQLYKLMPDASIDVSKPQRYFGATAKTLSDSNIRQTTFSSTLGKDCNYS